MKIYVDEIPECCNKCEWFTPNHCNKDGRNFCLMARMPLYNLEEDRKTSRGQHKGSLSDFDCPLQSLAEHEKELIKKIKLALRKQVCQMRGDEHCYPQNVVCWQDVVAIIDQIERSEKDE